MPIKAKSLARYQVEISNGRHIVIADEPPGVGDDQGPSPYEYLLIALAACKIITARMYAERKGWPLEKVELSLAIDKIHARDCEDCESDPNALIDYITGEVRFIGDLSEAQIQRLAEIADRCPVQRTLTSETKVQMQVHPGVAIGEG
jgi:putative redox protein